MKLSHSGTQVLQQCEAKYWHKYVNKTPNDSDYVDEKESYYQLY
jgi:hypothetical protein